MSLSKFLRPSLLGLLLAGGCMPYSFTTGKLGQQMTPWEFRTQYAFWDEHESPGGSLAGGSDFPLRSDAEGGTFLRLRLHGFMFNPSDDRRDWNALQENDFARGIRSEPWLFVTVRLANKLGDKETVEFDPANPSTANDKASIVVDETLFYPGTSRLRPSSEYPDEAVAFGSKVSVKVEFSALSKKPGPLGVVSGKITYTVDKAGGDPEDAVTGELTVNFSAQVEGERLSECNDSVSFGSGTSPACANLDPSKE